MVTGRWFWRNVICIPLVAGLLWLAHTVPDIDPDENYHLTVNGSTLEYSGGIPFGVTAKVKSLLDASPNVKVINLNSYGGRIREGRELRDLIIARKLSTHTSEECASACTLAFMAGVKRTMADDARVGFHRAYDPDASDADLDDEIAVDRKWMRARRIPVWFIDKAYATPHDSMWWVPHQILRQVGILTSDPGGPKAVIASSRKR
jgi:hypothetical protein